MFKRIIEEQSHFRCKIIFIHDLNIWLLLVSQRKSKPINLKKVSSSIKATHQNGAQRKLLSITSFVHALCLRPVLPFQYTINFYFACKPWILKFAQFSY